MKLSWSQALPAAILVLDVATASKCKHSPSGLSSSSTSISTTSSSEPESTSSSVSVEVIITTTIESSSSSSSSVASSSSDAEPESSSSSSESSSESFSATPTSSSATLTQSSSFSATTLSSSVIPNTCSAGVLATAGTPDLASRLADCSAYNKWTVTPPTSLTTTTTWYSTSWSFTSTETVTITTTSPSPLNFFSKRTITHGGVTATGMDGTVTVRPTGIPDYASAYCDGYEAYFDACSEGVSAATSTAPRVTSTTTESLVQTCYGNYIFTKYLGVPFPFFEPPAVTTLP
ncbi:hypothetical protein PG993_012619 [Apiospora rasikravindrae]|uniref:Uncharacterized protein n=1 Tax=Apiospora rasikravindrae TaxID=990691 RepID=A0ABR1S348_9PEZI